MSNEFHVPEDTPLLYRRFSIFERDRRWAAVRKLMDRDGLSAIVAPPNPGNSTDWQADARYLSHCGGGGDTSIGVVFPASGDVTVVTTSAVERWGAHVQDWVTDLRTVNRRYGEAMADRLIELRLTKERIGICGLSGGTRTPEGTILHGTYEALSQALPSAEFVDASGLLQEVREVKSAEELDVLQTSINLVERSIDALLRAAQPGVPDYVVWAETMHALFSRGSELSVHFNWISGQNPGRTLTRPNARLLVAGDLILGELEASVIGYRAQRLPVIAVNHCDQIFQQMSDVHGEMYARLLERLEPGITVRHLIKETLEIAESVAPKRGPLAGLKASLIMHGRGLGDDAPLVLTKLGGDPFYEATVRAMERKIPEHGVYVLKPTIGTADNRYQFAWGDSVHVQHSGAKRMGCMPHGLQISASQRFVDWPKDVSVFDSSPAPSTSQVHSERT